MLLMNVRLGRVGRACFFAAMGALIFGCTHRNDTERIRVRLKVFKETDRLDPTRIDFGAEYTYLENLTVRLIALSPSGLYEGQLAESFAFENQGKDLRVHLRKASFSDGCMIGAEDVARTIKRAVLRGSSHSDPKRFILGAEKLVDVDQDFEGVKIIGPTELVIRTVHPVKEILYYLQLADFGILAPKQARAPKLALADWADVTSGPFRLKRGDGKMLFVRNEKSMQFAPDMPELIEPVDLTGDQVVPAILAGDVDLGSLTFEEFVRGRRQLMAQKKVDLFGTTGTDGLAYLTLNVRDPRFSSVKTRRWIYARILRDFKLKGEFAEVAQKASQYFLPNAKGYVPLLSGLIPPSA